MERAGSATRWGSGDLGLATTALATLAQHGGRPEQSYERGWSHVQEPIGQWPALPLDEWSDTRDTLQLWTQIVGKVRLANEPLAAHWWNVTLYPTVRGLTTSLMPHGSGASFQIDFDLRSDRLDVTTTTGDTGSIALRSMPMVDFYTQLMQLLDKLGVGTPIWPVPVEIPGAIPFPDDGVHSVYDPAYAQRFWQALVEVQRVLKVFRSDFVGKVSPVHLFWGGLDLAVTRFSGRPAPPYPRSVPNCGPNVMREAYSHEVSSAGYWPGGDDEGVFYSYAYPEPDGFRTANVRPAAAHYDGDLAEFVLPYTAVRTADHPGRALLEFLHSTYDAAATFGGWDRAALERHWR